MKLVEAATGNSPSTPISCAGATATLGTVAVARGDPLWGFPAHSWAAFAGATAVSQLAGVFGIV